MICLVLAKQFWRSLRCHNWPGQNASTVQNANTSGNIILKKAGGQIFIVLLKSFRWVRWALLGAGGHWGGPDQPLSKLHASAKVTCLYCVGIWKSCIWKGIHVYLCKPTKSWICFQHWKLPLIPCWCSNLESKTCDILSTVHLGSLKIIALKRILLWTTRLS